MYTSFFFRVVIVTLVVCLPGIAAAATLYMSPNSGTYTVGQTIPVGIYVDSTGADINGTGLTISYDRNVFEAISVTTSNSIIDFWATQPTAAAGVATMEGVSFSGYTGRAGRIATLTLRAKTVGRGAISITDGEVLAHDGLGTSLPTSFAGASFQVDPVPPVVVPEPEPEEVVEDIATTTEVVSSTTPATTTPPEREDASYTYIWWVVGILLVLLLLDSLLGFYFYRKWRRLVALCNPKRKQ